MKLHNIKPAHINQHKKQIARGNSGKGGTTGGRGSKGQKARTGFNLPKGFEGGQTKLSMRMPKIGGFKRYKKPNYIIKSSKINKYFKAHDEVNPVILKKIGLLNKYLPNQKIKILFDEKLTEGITIKDCSFSKTVYKH